MGQLSRRRWTRQRVSAGVAEELLLMSEPGVDTVLDEVMESAAEGRPSSREKA